MDLSSTSSSNNLIDTALFVNILSVNICREPLFCRELIFSRYLAHRLLLGTNDHVHLYQNITNRPLGPTNIMKRLVGYRQAFKIVSVTYSSHHSSKNDRYITGLKIGLDKSMQYQYIELRLCILNYSNGYHNPDHNHHLHQHRHCHQSSVPDDSYLGENCLLFITYYCILLKFRYFLA